MRGRKGQGAASSTAPGAVRIIGGQYRRSVLPVPDRRGLRPTPLRLRQTLFDWLGFLCPGAFAEGWAACRVADVFAGTGALGFEAASRGALHVDLVEADADVARTLHRTRERLAAGAVTVHRADGLAWLARQPAGSLHLVLLDPPFGTGLEVQALKLVRPLVHARGWVYLEAPRRHTETELAEQGFGLLRHAQAGAVHAHLLTVQP